MTDDCVKYLLCFSMIKSKFKHDPLLEKMSPIMVNVPEIDCFKTKYVWVGQNDQ